MLQLVNVEREGELYKKTKKGGFKEYKFRLFKNHLQCIKGSDCCKGKSLLYDLNSLIYSVFL